MTTVMQWHQLTRTLCYQGMRVAMDRDTFLQQLTSAKTEAQKSFGDQVMLVEKFVETPRSVQGHIVTQQ